MNNLSTTAFQGLQAEVSKKKRAKGRRPVWKCNIFAGEQRIFLSDWISIDFLEKGVAQWFCELIMNLESQKVYSTPLGHLLPMKIRGQQVDFAWVENEFGDQWLRSHGCFAHVEHLSGAFRGGIWFFSVSSDGEVIGLSSLDIEQMRIKSIEANRWFCELLITAIYSGVIQEKTINPKLLWTSPS